MDFILSNKIHYDTQIYEDQQISVVFELEVLIADMWNSCNVKDYIYLIVHYLLCQSSSNRTTRPKRIKQEKQRMPAHVFVSEKSLGVYSVSHI